MKYTYVKPTIETENILTKSFACCKDKSWTQSGCDVAQAD